MQGKKIIIFLIIINILLVSLIYNYINKYYLYNEKLILKTMTETEYEDNITSLNQSHTEYANHIEESKKKIASAITDMGIPTSEEDTLDTMVNNIKNIVSDELVTETQTISEWHNNNVEKEYTLTFSDNIKGIYIKSVSVGSNNLTCHTIYVPILSEYQFIQSTNGSHYALNIGTISDSTTQYRVVNIVNINGSTVTIKKGGWYANATTTIEVTAIL